MPGLALFAVSAPLLHASAAVLPVPAGPQIVTEQWSLAQTVQAEEPPQEAGAAPPDADEPTGTIVVEGSYGPPERDPIERINAESYRITQEIDAALIEPLAYAYRDGLPEPLRDGLGNVVRNLGEPSNALNFLLQGKVGKAFETLGRLAINSTVGVGGLFDIAERPAVDLPYRRNGFANTAGFYGVGPGPYLYLPVTGATTVRDVIGSTLDQLLLPLAVGKPFSTWEYVLPYFTVNGLDARLAVDAELAQIRASDDPYAQRRDTYLARREREIAALKGEVAEEEAHAETVPAGVILQPAPPEGGAAAAPPKATEALIITRPR